MNDVDRAVSEAEWTDFWPAETWVYFIQAGAAGPIKVGSARDPRERLAALQTASADELRLIGCTQAPKAFETVLHRDFSHLRIRGEWFRPHPDLVSLAASYGLEELS